MQLNRLSRRFYLCVRLCVCVAGVLQHVNNPKHITSWFHPLGDGLRRVRMTNDRYRLSLWAAAHMVHSSAVITLSNVTRYCIHHCIDSGRVYITVSTRKTHPYLALTGELRDVFCQNSWKNWPRYNGTALYSVPFMDTFYGLQPICVRMSDISGTQLIK